MEGESFFVGLPRLQGATDLGRVASEADAIDHVQFTEEEIRAITTVAKNLGDVHVSQSLKYARLV